MKDGTKVVDDPTQIKSHTMMASPGFALRLTVALAKGGSIVIWLGVAAVGLAKLKTACEGRGLELTSPFIPTYGSQLHSKYLGD